MKTHEFKELLIRSLDKESNAKEASRKVQAAGANFEFSKEFLSKVMNRIYETGSVVAVETEFLRNLTFVFYRIALPGIAAIILMVLSVLFMEGSLSINSFLGLGNNNEESIICLLTGN